MPGSFPLVSLQTPGGVCVEMMKRCSVKGSRTARKSVSPAAAGLCLALQAWNSSIAEGEGRDNFPPNRVCCLFFTLKSVKSYG